MPILLTETRTMMQAIDLIMPAKVFFRDVFFPDVRTFVTEKVDVDYRKGKRKMAPFVARKSGGITMDRQGFRTDTYTTPYIAPQRVMTKDDIGNRLLGENIYSTRTPAQRAQELLAMDLVELEDMITRREEWVCREILLTGAVTLKGWIDKIGGTEYVEDTIDYGFTNHDTLAGADAWDQDTSDKHGDLKRIRLAVVQKTGQNPNIVVMASNVAELFINDTKIQAMFDNRRMTIGTIEPRVQNDGLTYMGTLTDLGLEIYSYDEWFVDDDGSEKALLPDDYLIMGRRGLGSRLYGAVTQIEESDRDFHTYEGTRIPRAWTDVNNDMKMLRVASRPLPKPDDVDSWYTLKVK